MKGTGKTPPPPARRGSSPEHAGVVKHLCGFPLGHARAGRGRARPPACVSMETPPDEAIQGPLPAGPRVGLWDTHITRCAENAHAWVTRALKMRPPGFLWKRARVGHGGAASPWRLQRVPPWTLSGPAQTRRTENARARLDLSRLVRAPGFPWRRAADVARWAGGVSSAL